MKPQNFDVITAHTVDGDVVLVQHQFTGTGHPTGPARARSDPNARPCAPGQAAGCPTPGDAGFSASDLAGHVRILTRSLAPARIRQKERGTQASCIRSGPQALLSEQSGEGRVRDQGLFESALHRPRNASHGICKSALIFARTCNMTSALTAAFFFARKIFQSRDFTWSIRHIGMRRHQSASCPTGRPKLTSSWVLPAWMPFTSESRSYSIFFDG